MATTIDDYKYLNEIESEIKNKTKNQMGNIFESYKLLKSKFKNQLKKNDLTLHILPSLPQNKKTLFFDYVHLNPQGNKIIAEYIFNIIKDKLNI